MSEKNIAPLTAFPTITTEMIEQFEILTDFVRPAEFRNQLVNLYLQFIISDPEGFPGDFKNITDNLYIFLEFLTHLQEAIDNRKQ
ncbi:hypothetical protein [Roseivirga sp.]|uniref:hypothetical protein n=1 Tax=Roseivirga sp. TaxID=1964215 RepID=UPI003B51FAD6